MNRIAGNYRKPCGSIIPKEKHLQTKAETFLQRKDTTICSGTF
ncbi:hypothetical protein Barb6XT_02906 [Bacteroidales bacterium Barb6XT]|nr:hypothetical protein Barb6XT_02906 [Bacteroidales bacterium Barb6XT]